MGSMELGRVSLALALALLFSACGVLQRQAAPGRIQTVRAAFERDLANFYRISPRAYPCDAGWVASPDGYVVATERWIEEGGLRSGDKITAIGGVETTSREERSRAMYQVAAGGPLLVTVKRDNQARTLSIPCRYRPELWTAARQVLVAGASGDWDACVSP